MKASVAAVILLLVGQFAHAGDIRWEGNYRAEGLRVADPSLSGGNGKAYMLHHFTLRPHIDVYDGVSIHGRFDLFNSSRYPNDQLGQVFGAGLNSNPGTPVAPTATTPGQGTNASNSNTLSRQQPSDFIAVNELYMNYAHEFGVLTVGRVPLYFGLGMMFNSGRGLFDHWLENRDVVAYTLKMGNLSVMPAIAKTYEGQLDQEDDINDYILKVDYENPETELQVGAIYQARRSTRGANSNDAPMPVTDATATHNSNYEVDTYNIFVSQWVDQVKVAFEIGFQKGRLGHLVNGESVRQEGVGAVLKLSWQPEDSRWGALVDLGYASGDDPNNPNVYGGYMFSRNYDVAFLLFNHPMGRADFLRTSYMRNTATSGAATTFSASNTFDTETVSNASFISAAGNYHWADHKYNFEARLTYAMLNKDPLQTGVDSSLGTELDLSLKYEPIKGFQWINRAGVFLPGAAFTGGTNNFSTNTSFGIETKAAITF